MKKYYINKENNEIITSDAFIDCGNQTRKELLEKYEEMTARDMYDYIAELGSWDDIEAEAYEYLCDLLDLDYNEFKDPDELLEEAKQRLLVRYTVEDTETGNVFDSFKDLNKAIEWVKELVLEDIQSGTYEEDYHSIYKEENGEKELLFVDSDIISKEEEIFRFNLKEFEALIGEKVLLSELIDKIDSDYDYPDEERLSSREALIEEEFLQFNIHPKFFYKDDLPLHYITIGFTVSEIYDYESEEDDAEIVINEITYDYY